MTRVWFDADREHFWLVPEDAIIPAGNTPIRSLTGGKVHADVDAMDAYALEREDARRAVREELRDAASHAGRALGAAAQDAWVQASDQLPDLSWKDLEERLGPMDTWIDGEAWKASREQVESRARQARATIRRAGRVATSAVKSARAMGKVVLENPELAEQASRWAEVLSGTGRNGRRAPGDEDDR